MKAACVRRYGPPGVVEIGDVPDPDLGGGQVLVRVRAASLNPLDSKLRSGSLRPILPLRMPAILGFDFAGEIVALGSRVMNWTLGDSVYGRIEARTGGTHAELAAVDAQVVDRVPNSLSMEEAASFPLTGMTAVQGLRKARLSPGHRLLVIGASGGVGSMAVQVGRAWGADVTGVCRGESASLVAGLGASRVLDYTKGELERADARFDVVFDTVFNRPWSDVARVLEADGAYVTTGFSFGLAVRALWERLRSGPRAAFVVSRADGSLMRELSQLVNAGKVVPVVDSRFPLSRIVEAYERLEGAHVRGKIVIAIP